MIGLHIQFQHLDALFLTTQVIDLLLHILPHIPTQYPIAIFGAEHNVILAFIHTMR
jgi:hypothetical protein